MSTIRSLRFVRVAIAFLLLWGARPAWGQDQTVNGNLDVTGTLDVRGNQLTLGTQASSFGAGFFYFDANTDTLNIHLNRSTASWLWEHNTAVSAMRLDSAHNLLLYTADGSVAGLTLNPTTNTISLGDVTFYRSGAGTLRTSGGMIVDGAFTSASFTSSGGTITGGATGLALNAGGADQSVTINASGTGNISLGNAGAATFTGDLRPHVHNTFDLGAPLQRWRSAYINGGTVTGSLLVDTGNISGGTAGLIMQAGAADQDVALSTSGTGSVLLSAPLILSKNAATLAQFRRTDSTPAGVGLTIGADNAGPYLDTQQVHNLRIFVNGVEVGRFASSGSLLLGTTSDGSNGMLQLASHATAAGGIGFGSDVSLYRSAAATLKTDGNLAVAGNARFDGAVRIAPQGDLSMGEFTNEP
ncbi:MAG: hypothetical protein PSV13_08115 [Lacunisphaera sp.]|nr:hypothetical protein [Lacunisphaera sp.]